MISIVIPFYNRWELTHARLLELYKFAPDDIEIILVDDASTDENIQSGVAWWQKTVAKHKIRYHRNEQNLGFVGSMNIGTDLALKHEADIIILLSNDVVISGDVVTDVVTVLQQDNRSLIGGKIIDWNSGWNDVIYKGHPMFVPYCEGWFLACASSVWKELGGFDPIYSPSDFEDVCLSTTAHYLGINLVALNSNKLNHLVARSYGYNPEREARTKRNREYWLKKWDGKWDEISNSLR